MFSLCDHWLSGASSFANNVWLWTHTGVFQKQLTLGLLFFSRSWNDLLLLFMNDAFLNSLLLKNNPLLQLHLNSKPLQRRHHWLLEPSSPKDTVPVKTGLWWWPQTACDDSPLVPNVFLQLLSTTFVLGYKPNSERTCRITPSLDTSRGKTLVCGPAVSHVRCEIFVGSSGFMKLYNQHNSFPVSTRPANRAASRGLLSLTTLPPVPTEWGPTCTRSVTMERSGM